MLLVYVVCKNGREAEKIAREAVKRKLAACANYCDATSVYLWKEKLVKETILHLKTIEKNYASLERLVKKLHSYDVPCIIAFPVTKAEKHYAEWVSGSCSFALLFP